jgi:hypothetical protein
VIVYLAGNPNDHETIEQHANELIQLGAKFGRIVSIASKWHKNDEFANDVAEIRRIREAADDFIEAFLQDPERRSTGGEGVVGVELGMRLEAAVDDCIKGLNDAEIVIAEMPGGAIEAGFALAKGKKVITIGDSPSPLTANSESHRAYNDWIAAMAHILRPRLGRSLFQSMTREV